MMLAMAAAEPPTIIEVSSHAGTARLAARGPTVRIGRAADNDVVLSNEPTISRHHAELRRADDGWAICDVGSHNGTHVNGRRLASGVAQPINDRDVVMVGGATLRLLSDLAGDGLTVEDVNAGAAHLQLGALSAREQEVLSLVAAGLTDDQVATQLYISVKTVHSHLDRIRDKTGVRRRADLTRLAGRLGLLGRHP